MNEIIEELLTLLEATFSTTFKKYYYGQVQIPAKAIYPCLMVYPNSSLITFRGTKRDNNRFQITIAIEDTAKNYYRTGGNNNPKLEALQQLVKWMEERNADGSYKTSTILKILRENLDIGSTVQFTDNVTINYDSYFPDGEDPTVRAELVFEAMSVPDRS